MDLEIQARQNTLEPEWRELIERQTARLSARFARMIRLHVTLRHARRNRTGAEHAALVASVPGRTLHAEKRGADVPAALHAAFDAMEIELARDRQGRRRE